jgi:hypothetical protein
MENDVELVVGILSEGVGVEPRFTEAEARELVNRIERDAIERALNNYESLLEDSKTLARLHAGGVDNWEGYDQAVSGAC